jgi:UTP--glucose-1-phosphate uridylyltransferase
MKLPRKAVIAAAGFGTRFLPQTKAMPKEMLPIVDKPIIQYVVEDLVAAGITDIIIVNGFNKRSIEDHFDEPNADLVANLEMGGAKKKHLIDEVRAIAGLANFVYVRQRRMYGNGVPVLEAESLVGNEPFIFAFADELLPASPNVFKQAIRAHKELGGSIVPCLRIQNDDEYNRFGIVGGKQVSDGVIKMSHAVEKPGPKNAPSDLGSHGGYVFTPKIFKYLKQAAAALKPGQELYINDGIQAMIDDGHPVYAVEIKNGLFCDTGNKLDYLKTVVHYALQRDDLGKEFKAYLDSLK